MKVLLLFCVIFFVVKISEIKIHHHQIISANHMAVNQCNWEWTTEQFLMMIEHNCNLVDWEKNCMDVQTTLWQACEDTMLIYTKISKECFKDLVLSLPRREMEFRAVKGPT